MALCHCVVVLRAADGITDVLFTTLLHSIDIAYRGFDA